MKKLLNFLSHECLQVHLKHDHRMQRYFLKGEVGDVINTMLATTDYNLKNCLNKVIFVLERKNEILIAEILIFSTTKLLPAMSGLEKMRVLAGLTN